MNVSIVNLFFITNQPFFNQNGFNSVKPKKGAEIFEVVHFKYQIRRGNLDQLFKASLVQSNIQGPL